MEFTLENLKVRLDIETEHAAFIADFAGFPKPLQSEVIRLVAGEKPAELLGFNPDEFDEYTEAENGQMLLLSKLCDTLAFEGLNVALASTIAYNLNQASLGEGYHDHDGVPLIEAALAIAELNSPTPALVAKAPPPPEPLAEAVERLGALHSSREQLPWGVTLLD